ncbi:MAG: hypothetical protein JXR76_02705 [Deltaproteobacteria bacterium]|nr:hypothetical protein [Deltaproteobacteria bacterium]
MTESPLLKIAVDVSQTLLWIFTTPTGLLCLMVGWMLVFFVRFFKALKDRSLLLAASGKKSGLISGVSVLMDELVSVGVWMAANIPLLIGVVAILSVLVALSGTVAKVDEYLNLQQKIREYSLVLKNLERRYKVAKVKCVKQENGVTTLSIQYFDQNGNAVKGSQERIEINGQDIFIDALVVNFAYSGIESGEKRNLAVPYRVFSEKVAQKDGVPLKIASAGTVPFVYERAEYQILGMNKEAFDARLSELLAVARDAERARKAGMVRSVYGNAVHRVMTKDDVFFIWVEQSGGLTIKEEYVF